MAIRKYKPTTPGRRGSSVADFAEITRSTPEKSLLRPLSKTGGRNNQGRITTRHIGGGHKRQYRLIDFRRNDKDGIDAKVAHIEYDPNRTARIALLHYATARSATSSPRRSCRRATSSSRVPAPTSSPATTCRCANPHRYRDPRDRAASRRRSEDGPFGRRLGASGREGRPLRAAASALRRDPQRRRALPRHDRRGRQRRAVEHQLGQGRPHALEGRPPDRAWCRHEPGRPPARWW